MKFCVFFKKRAVPNMNGIGRSLREHGCDEIHFNSIQNDDLGFTITLHYSECESVNSEGAFLLLVMVD